MKMPPKAKKKFLTLQDRVMVIKMTSNGKSCNTIAEELAVGRTQIQSIVKRKIEILEDYKSNLAEGAMKTKNLLLRNK